MKSLIYFIVCYVFLAVDSIYFSYKLVVRFRADTGQDYLYFIYDYFANTYGGLLTVIWMIFGGIAIIIHKYEKKKAMEKTEAKIEGFKKKSFLRKIKSNENSQ